MTAALLLPLIGAIVGGGLLWVLRNDTNEFNLGRTPWVVLSWGGLSALAYFTHPTAELANLAGVVALLAFLLTYAHGPILSPPSQPYSDTPDPIEWSLMCLQGKVFGDRMGYPAWITYAAIRYAFPCFGIAFLLDAPAMYAAGIISVLGYWPFAYLVASGENTKYVGAVVFGMATGGLLGLDWQHFIQHF